MEPLGFLISSLLISDSCLRLLSASPFCLSLRGFRTFGGSDLLALGGRGRLLPIPRRDLVLVLKLCEEASLRHVVISRDRPCRRSRRHISFGRPGPLLRRSACRTGDSTKRVACGPV